MGSKKIKTVLTIAGSDSSGGAGVQADLKTFEAFGVFGTSAITALTAQNTLGVQAVHKVPASFVEEQIESVMNDIGADAWKIGMLYTENIIKVVVTQAIKHKVKLLVIDPVLVSTSGKFLLEKKAIPTFIKELLPLSFVITPNLPEVKVLTNLDVCTVSQMKEAAKILYNMGAKNVVIKGGHLPLELPAIDLLYDGKEFHEFSNPRIVTKNTHGTGCTFASAIAAELAKGHTVYEAVSTAKKYLTETMIAAKNFKIGQGNGPLYHSLKAI